MNCRMNTLMRNMRERREHPFTLNVPVFRDFNTASPFVDESITVSLSYYLSEASDYPFRILAPSPTTSSWTMQLVERECAVSR